MTKLTQATAVAIATATSQVRGDWDHPGILAALKVEADKGTSAEDVFIAIANLAGNPEARTPGLLNKPGAWWQKPAGRIVRRGDHDVPCPEHALSEPCPACKARNEADAITEAERIRLAAELRAEITAGLNRFHTRPMPSRVPPPGDAPRTENQ